MGERQLIGADGEAHRPKNRARMRDQIRVLRERRYNHVPHGIQRHDAKEHQNETIDKIEE